MGGPNSGDEIDLFDNIDDLIQFPDDGECVGMLSASDDAKDVVPTMWSGALPEFSADLSVPYEDIQQLEWLSVFVEDSFSAEGGLALPKQTSVACNKDDDVLFSPNRLFQSSSPVSVLESHSSSSSSSSCSGPMLGPGPHRGARSKRPRPATFNPRPPTFIDFPHPFIAPDSENFGALNKFPKHAEEPKQKKNKKIKTTTTTTTTTMTDLKEDHHQNLPPVRKCLHCEITKTPQWRAGPMGPKTLCNACGVRYKSGRLFPEYRPAASPTFVPSVHSNSHKKVIEMRNRGVAQTPAITVSELISNP